MFHNKQELIGIYSSDTPNQAVLTNFKVTTTSGKIIIDWGDSTAQLIDSNTSTSHTFYCPDEPAPVSFWRDITVCV